MLPVILAAAQFAYGAYQKSKADQALKNLGERDNYTVSPELQNAYSRAMEMSTQGYTAAEKGSFRGDIAKDINTKSQRALDIGGGSLSRVISGIGKIDEMGAEANFARDNARLMRDNIRHADVLAGQIQGQKNLATGSNIDNYNREAAAFGQAGSDGVTNMFGGLNLAAQGISAMGGGAPGAMNPNYNSGYRAPMKPTPNNLMPSDAYNSGYWDNFSSYGQQPVNPYVTAGGR